MQDRSDGRARSSSIIASSGTSTGKLDTATASMAKYWITDLQGKIIDRCLQLFGGYGYMHEYRSRACSSTPAYSGSMPEPTRS